MVGGAGAVAVALGVLVTGLGALAVVVGVPAATGLVGAGVGAPGELSPHAATNSELIIASTISAQRSRIDVCK